MSNKTEPVAENLMRIIHAPIQEKVEFNKTAKSGYSWEITASCPERVLELHNKMKQLFPEEQVEVPKTAREK